MRPALLAIGLAATAAHAQTLRLGADVVAGDHGQSLSVGAAGLVAVRGPEAGGLYAALRPEVTVGSEGGTGFYDDLDVLYYGDDGLPVYGGSTCQSASTGEAVGASRCGDDTFGLALGAEVGGRLPIGRGAALVGLGGRLGAGAGVYGALTGRLAEPIFARLEVGTGHVMVGLGFGGL